MLCVPQAVASSARDEEAELYSRPSGESPRVFATTPRYFANGGGVAYGDENLGREENGKDVHALPNLKLKKLELRESHSGN